MRHLVSVAAAEEATKSLSLLFVANFPVIQDGRGASNGHVEAEPAATALICRVHSTHHVEVHAQCLRFKLRLDAHQSQCGECGETFPPAKKRDAVVENQLLDKMVTRPLVGATQEVKHQGYDAGVALLWRFALR